MPNQYFGLSTDGKPLDVPVGSIYMEVDTCKFYYFNGYSWEEMPCHCEESDGIKYLKKITVTLNDTAITNFISYDYIDGENYVRSLLYDHGLYYTSYNTYSPRPEGNNWTFYIIEDDDPFVISVYTTGTGDPDEMIVTGDAVAEQDQDYDGHWDVFVSGDCTITLKENLNP